MALSTNLAGVAAMNSCMALTEATFAKTYAEDFEKSKSLADLNAAISSAEGAISFCPDGDRNQSSYISMLGTYLRRRYETTSNVKDYDDACRKMQDLVEASGPNTSRHEHSLRALIDIVICRYKKTDRIQDLRKLIRTIQLLISTVISRGKVKAAKKSIDMIKQLHLEAYRTTRDVLEIQIAISGHQKLLADCQLSGTREFLTRLDWLTITEGSTSSSDDVSSDSDSNSDLEGVKSKNDGITFIRKYIYRHLLGLMEFKCKESGAAEDMQAFGDQLKLHFKEITLPRPHRLHLLGDLSDLWEAAFEKNGRLVELEGLIGALKEILCNSLPSDGGKRINIMNKLSGYLSAKYDKTKDLTDLEESLNMALRTLPAAEADRDFMEDSIMPGGVKSALHYNVASKCFELYEITKKMDHLNSAIKYARTSADAAIQDKYLAQSSRYYALGTYLESRYQETDSPNDLEQACTALERSIDCVPAKDRSSVGDLADVAEKLAERLDQLKHLKNNPSLGLKADRIRSEFKKMKDAPRLATTSESYTRMCNATEKFLESSTLEDLNRAIQNSETELSALDESDHRKSNVTLHLVGLLIHRFEAQGDQKDLYRVINLIPHNARMLTSMLDINKAERAYGLSLRSIAQMYLFEDSGDEKPIVKAFEDGCEAVRLSGLPGAESHKAICCTNYARVFVAKFQRSQDLFLIDEAIRLFKAALAAADEVSSEPTLPSSSSAEADRLKQEKDADSSRSRVMTNLAAAEGVRFHKTGLLTDLQNAIAWAEEALDTIPADSPSPMRHTMASNLGSLLLQRYERLMKPADLDSAVTLLQDSADAAKGSVTHFTKINNLASALLQRSRARDRPEDLDAAVELLRAAAEEVPESHPNAETIRENLKALERIRVQKRSRVPPMFRMMMEALTGQPFDEDTVDPYMQALLDQGVKNGEFGPDGNGFDLRKMIGM